MDSKKVLWTIRARTKSFRLEMVTI